MRNKSVVLFCLFLNLLSFNGWTATISQTEDETVTKKYCYLNLTGYQQSLFEGFIATEFPKGKTVKQILADGNGLREKTRLAQALLFRNNQGDRANAIEILNWILKNQHTDEKSDNYGMWKTNVPNDRLDKNWREFIGCDLIITYQEYKDVLPAQLLADLKKGLIRAAWGALRRDVGADYSNISVMSAFLMEYTGTTFHIAALKTGGLKKAHEIYHLHQQHQTFSEYNSPTYCGVTLIGLALWRELGSSELKKMGTALENALWHEIASNYNPNLKNFVGPYFRGYGMDMAKYYAITAIWIAIAMDEVKLAPLPLGKGEKEGEMSNISPILHLGLCIPKLALLQLKAFSPRQFIERSVPSKILGDTLKMVTAVVNKDWMMGGLWGNRRVWNQIKTATIHWQNPHGEVEWLLVPGEGITNVRVSQTSMHVYRADTKSTEFSVYLYSKVLSESNFDAQTWKFPGMELSIHSTLKRSCNKITDRAILYEECGISEEYPSVMKITFQVPLSWRNEDQLLEIVPAK